MNDIMSNVREKLKWHEKLKGNRISQGLYLFLTDCGLDVDQEGRGILEFIPSV